MVVEKNQRQRDGQTERKTAISGLIKRNGPMSFKQMSAITRDLAGHPAQTECWRAAPEGPEGPE